MKETQIRDLLEVLKQHLEGAVTVVGEMMEALSGEGCQHPPKRRRNVSGMGASERREMCLECGEELVVPAEETE